jgi:two-component system C4-dicarboxylate transport response regulator DctD
LRNVADATVLGVGPQWNAPQQDPHTKGDETTAAQSLSHSVDQFERSLIEEALQQHEGNVSLTAKYLQTPKTTLIDKLKKHGLGKAGTP